MSKKSLRAKAISVLRLVGERQSGLAETTGTTRDGKRRQTDLKGGNRVYNSCLLGSPKRKCRLKSEILDSVAAAENPWSISAPPISA